MVKLSESPLRVLKRTITQGIKTGLVWQISPVDWPALARLVAKRGLGAHMVHAFHQITTPTRLAIVDEHRQLTFSQLNTEINQLAHTLQGQYNIQKRSPVILMMENRAEYITSWVSLFRLGAQAVHASYRSSVEELAYQVEHSNAKLIITSEHNAKVAYALQTQRPELNVLLVTNPDSDLAMWQAHQPDIYAHLIAKAPTTWVAQNSRKNSSENIVYTSGTTGKPKGAVRNFLGFGLKELFRVIERLPFESGERHLVVCPLYHSGAQAFTLLHSALGSTLYLKSHFDAQGTLQNMSQNAIHSVFLGPTMIHRMVMLDDQTFKRWPTPALRAIISGAAPFPQALRLKAMARFGTETIYDFYGATEMGWVTLIGGREMLNHPGSVGRPIAGQHIRIINEDGQTLPTGEVGLIYVHNGQAMSGYLNNPKATNDARLEDWITVEDLGHLDDEGYLYVSGRARDMIISGGVNIYPVEIEEVLAHHPNVREVAVIGVPDEEWGERLEAVVVTEDGLPPQAEALIGYARDHLSGYKIPRTYHQLDVLPRNPTGKVIKRQLREQFQEG